jgi:hypothetical protein
VELISFATGSRSVNKQDLWKNLKNFQVAEASIQSIYSKLAMRVFDVYANILKCMYSTRFSGTQLVQGLPQKPNRLPMLSPPHSHFRHLPPG